MEKELNELLEEKGLSINDDKVNVAYTPHGIDIMEIDEDGYNLYGKTYYSAYEALEVLDGMEALDNNKELREMNKHFLISTINAKGEEYNTIVDESGKDRDKEIIKFIEVSGEKVVRYNEIANRINIAAENGTHDDLSWKEKQEVLNEIVKENKFRK